MSKEETFVEEPNPLARSFSHLNGITSKGSVVEWWYSIIMSMIAYGVNLRHFAMAFFSEGVIHEVKVIHRREEIVFTHKLLLR